jgi:3,4-dihydroxy 2-butanone 4-phosphate synthase / GTP cyclohydrolase II
MMREEMEEAAKYNSIGEAIEAIRHGKVIIVMDDKDRENEGDFICAAEHVTPAVVNFMLVHGRGQVCHSLLPEVCERLELHQMVDRNTAPLNTAFTIPVDHVDCRTGITAFEKAKTITSLIDPDAQPADFARPGHLFPLLAKKGGVLRRAGHTEAALDLARMAGCYPSGVLCEILNEEGDRASREELFELAKRFEMPVITIAELIRYRRRSEKLVAREAEALLPTKYGEARIIVYGVEYERDEPIAIVYGDPRELEAPLVRLHSSCFTGDLIASLRCDCGDQLDMALSQIGEEGHGVLVYLPQEGRGIGLAEKVKAYALQDKGLDTVDANLALGHKADLRDYGVGIQILKDLGLSKIRLLTNNPKKTDAFIYGGFDLDVVDQVGIHAQITEHNAKYLATKRDRMGHASPEED